EARCVAARRAPGGCGISPEVVATGRLDDRRRGAHGRPALVGFAGEGGVARALLAAAGVHERLGLPPAAVRFLAAAAAGHDGATLALHHDRRLGLLRAGVPRAFA